MAVRTGDGVLKTNLVLIGMPGVGKSTLGVILAKVLGYEFVDTDLVIQKSQEKLLKEIIAELGPEGFIALENRIISGLELTGSVVATGGSVVYGREAMQALAENGTIIYLKQELEELSRRLHNIRNRGVVLKEGQTLEDLYGERCSLYEQYADIIVDESGKDVEGTLEALRGQLKQYAAAGSGRCAEDA